MPSGFKLFSYTHLFLIIEQILPCGERAVEIYGINSGYVVSIKLIHAGQQDVNVVGFLA